MLSHPAWVGFAADTEPRLSSPAPLLLSAATTNEQRAGSAAGCPAGRPRAPKGSAGSSCRCAQLPWVHPHPRHCRCSASSVPQPRPFPSLLKTPQPSACLGPASSCVVGSQGGDTAPRRSEAPRDPYSCYLLQRPSATPGDRKHPAACPRPLAVAAVWLRDVALHVINSSCADILALHHPSRAARAFTPTPGRTETAATTRPAAPHRHRGVLSTPC